MFKVVGPDGTEQGPVDVATLRKLAAERRIQPETTLLDLNTGQRLPAHQLADLQTAFNTQASPAPASMSNASLATGLGCWGGFLAFVVLMLWWGFSMLRSAGNLERHVAGSSSPISSPAPIPPEPQETSKKDSGSSFSREHLVDSPPTSAPHPKAQGPSPEVKRYIQRVGKATDLLRDALSHTEEDSRQLSRNLDLLRDPAWKTQIATSLAGFEVFTRKVDEITDVPAEMSDLHADITEMARLARRFATTYADAVDAVDVERMEEALGYKNQMNTVAGRATPKLKAYIDKYGL